MLQIVPLLSPVYLSQLQVELLPIRVSRILLWRLISNLKKTLFNDTAIMGEKFSITKSNPGFYAACS